jgi:vitamin B12 transporter
MLVYFTLYYFYFRIVPNYFNKMKLKETIFIAMVLVWGTSAIAQQNLDSVYVSASRLPMKKFEVGKSITVISAEEIKALPATTVDELLRNLEGVNLNNRGGFGVQSDIGLRGSTFSQVLILVDNQRINDPLTAHFNSNIPIPLSEIHHIEVIRGSAAVSYGADAVGGVIHIKTKAFEGLSKTNSFNFSGNSALGQHDLKLTDLGFHQQGKHFGYSAAIKTSSALGQEFVNPNFIKAQKGDSLYSNHFNLKTYTGAITYSKNRFKGYVRLGTDQRYFGAKYFYTASPWDESVEEVNSTWSQGYLLYQGDRGKTDFTVGYRTNTDSFVFNPLFSANVHQTKRTNASLNHYRTFFKTQFVFGLQTDLQQIESNDRGDHEVQTSAFYVLANKRFNDLNANGGLRVELSDEAKVYIIPQLNIAYSLNNHVLRASAGRSIRQGDLTEKYSNFLDQQVAPGLSVGNEDLVSENSYNFDFGIDGYVNNRFKWGATFFARKSNDLIDYVLTNSDNITNRTNLQAGTMYPYATNISESSTLGFEANTRYTIVDGKKAKLKSQVNYTYINTNTPDSVVSKYIANHPIHNINLVLSLNIHRFNWSVTGNFVTRNEEKIESIDATIPSSYGLINSRVSYSSSIIPVRVFVEVRNLGDNSYQEILGARMPGRWVYGGLSWNL